MRSILEVMVQGITEVGDKAKVIVEVSGLRAQILQAEYEIEKIYTSIGRTVFNGRVSCEEASITMQKTNTLVDAAKVHLQEIEDLTSKILELSGEKKCSNCHEVIAVGTKYCPECGRENPVPEPKEPETSDDVKVCSTCKLPLGESAKFCGNCGKTTTEAE